MDVHCGAIYMYMNIIILLMIFFPAVVFGRPQLNSSTGSLELSGEQCPGTLTLTCDAVNFGISDSIGWFVGNERIAFFDANDDSTPFTTTTTRPDILNATVQLATLINTGGEFSFINFTLSANVSNFFPLQGQNITCGNIGLVSRSSSFEIREFTVLNKSALFEVTDATTLNISSSHTLQHSACEATFTCISAIDGECVVEIIRNDMIEQRQRGVVNSPVIFSNLMPNTLYFYRINLTDLQPMLIIENKNFTTNEGSCGSSTSTAVIVGVVVPVVVLVLVLVPAFVIILVRKHKMYQKKKAEPRHDLETWEYPVKAKKLFTNKHGELVDEEGKLVGEDLVISRHRCVGDSINNARTRIPEERLQHMRQLRRDQDPLIKEDSHVYDTTRFPNTASAGQSEANESVGEDYDHIEKNVNEYDRLHDQKKKKKNTKAPQDGNPVVYSGLNLRCSPDI